MSWGSSELAGIATDRQLYALRSELDSVNQALIQERTRYNQTLVTTAGIHAVRKAAESVISAVWPDHPLLLSEVKNGIYEAGERAWAVTKDWDAVMEAGRTFKLPPFDFEARFVAKWREQYQLLDQVVQDKDLEIQSLRARAELAERQLYQAQTRIQELAAQVTHLTSREKKLTESMMSANKDCCSHLAHASAFRAALEVSDPNNPLLLDPELRRRLARLAWDRLVASKADWRVVREIGRTFLMMNEAGRQTADVPPDLLVAEEVGDQLEAHSDQRPDLDAAGESAADPVLDEATPTAPAFAALDPVTDA